MKISFGLGTLHVSSLWRHLLAPPPSTSLSDDFRAHFQTMFSMKRSNGGTRVPGWGLRSPDALFPPFLQIRYVFLCSCVDFGCIPIISPFSCREAQKGWLVHSSPLACLGVLCVHVFPFVVVCNISTFLLLQKRLQ